MHISENPRTLWLDEFDLIHRDQRFAWTCEITPNLFRVPMAEFYRAEYVYYSQLDLGSVKHFCIKQPPQPELQRPSQIKPLKVLARICEIPHGSIVTKVTGTHRYTLFRECSVFTIDGSRQKFANLLIPEKPGSASISEVEDDKEVIWHTTFTELAGAK